MSCRDRRYLHLAPHGFTIRVSFGGFHDSGTARKEQGGEVLRFSTRVRTVAGHFGG